MYPFRNGEQVTTEKLDELARKLVTRLNEITNHQVVSLSVGQIISLGTVDSDTFMMVPMASTTEQYFDDYIRPVFKLDNGLNYGGENYIEFWLKEIEELKR